MGLGGKRQAGAHRVSWRLAHGEIPDELHVCHHCDNKRCVRPDHLFLGTRSDNLSDAAVKGRLGARNPLRGTAHGNARVSSEAVRTIRSIYQRRKGQVSASDIGFLFGLSESQVFNIISRRQWSHA